MSKKDIIILGAGLSGLSTAYHLEKLGINYKIFEKEAEVGGLCRSKNIDGFTFDCDGHLLHFKHKYTFNMVKNLLKGNLKKHARNAWIYSYGRYTHYPFQANFYGLPSRVVSDCLLGFINATDGRLKENISFLEWINHTFGCGIAKHFMINYNKKFWHYPLNKITCDWIDGYIPQPSLKDVIEGAIKESKKRMGYNAFFWYPNQGGIQELSLAFARRIKNINTSQEAVKIDIKNKVIYFKDGRRQCYQKLISTMPLVEIVDMIDDIPFDIVKAKEQLKCISIFNVNLGINKPLFSSRHWIYFPEKKYIFYRVGFFNNFSSCSAPKEKSSLYIEVSYPAGKQIDKEKLILHIIEDLVKAGIISHSDKIIARDYNDIKYGYIIYDQKHSTATNRILDFLASNNIFSIGRYGSWKYMTMEGAILEGKRTAQKIFRDEAELYPLS